jgi:hypothetical protein
MTIRSWALSAIALAVLTGCSANGSETVEPKPRTAETTTTIDPAKASMLESGRDYDVLASLPVSIHGQRASYRGVTPDGQVLGEITTPTRDDTDMGDVGSYSSAFLLDPHTKKVTMLSDGRTRSKETAVLGMVANESSVVWLEVADSNVGVGTWTLYTYDRSRHKETELASYEDEVQLANSVLDVQDPVIVGDMAFLTSDTIPVADGKGVRVLGVPIDGSGPMTVVVDGAGKVRGDGDAIVYEKGTQLIRDEIAAHQTTVVGDSARGACGSYVHSGVLVTCRRTDGRSVVTVTDGSGKAVAIGPFGTRISDVKQQPGWVMFGFGAKVYVFDVEKSSLFLAARTPFGVTLVGGDTALIAESRPDGDVKGYTLVTLR